MANELNLSDINYLNIFPHVGDVATIDVTSVESAGGRLGAGNYTFAIRYLDSFNTPTNFFSTSVPVAVPVTGSLSNPIGADGETITNRAVRLELSNLDTFYDQYQIAVIPRYDGVIGTPQLLPAKPITSSTSYFIYNGTENAQEISLEEIAINRASYKTAKAITQVDSSLYLGNMTDYPELNYQPYANNIKVKTVVKEYTFGIVASGVGIGGALPIARMNTATGKPGNPTELVYNAKGFKRGEVYAIYISFVFKDGSESPAFHIPGRRATSFEYEGATYKEDDPVPEFEEEIREVAGTTAEGNTAGKWFHFISHPDDTYNMGFWENQDEIYPYSTDWEVWDVNSSGEGIATGETLAGQRVRHHQMPDADQEPYYDESGNKIRVLGIELENVKIPKEFKDRIRAIRIHYAKRDEGNQRILDQSFALLSKTDDGPVDNTDTSRVTHRLAEQPEEAQTENSLTYLFHPFNLLRTKQNIQGLTHLKGIAKIDNPGLRETEDSNYQNFVENLSHNLDFGIPKEDRFKAVRAKSYIPSYGFPEEGSDNSIVRIEDVGFPRDFDNTNGEEKIAADITPIRADDPFYIPDYMYELCQFKENMYLDFDTQELVYTGFQFTDIDALDPTIQEEGSPSPSIVPAYSLGEIYGGDTFIGIWASRHTKWLKNSDKIRANIRQTLVECLAYPYYRSRGDEIYQQWYPGSTTNIEDYRAIVWRDGLPSTNKEGDVFPDNVIKYNIDFMMNETAKPAFPFQKRRSIANAFPTRIIRSRQSSPVEGEDLFRQFLPEDYMDLPTKRGAINKLTNLNNLLMPHAENSLFRTRGREELQTQDFRAFLGSGDIFELSPEELYETDIGYGGLQIPRAGIVTEYGYFYVDQKARKVFHLTREGLQEVSAEGLEQFFETALEFNFEELGFTKFRGASRYFGIEVSWDPVFKRYLLTKKDVKLKDPFDLDALDTEESSPSPSGSPTPDPTSLTFDETTQSFIDPYDNENRLEWDDPRFFEDDSFTLSYSPEIQAWISFHDYFPNMYFYNTNNFYSSLKGVLYRHGAKETRGRFYGAVYDSFIEYIDNRAEVQSGLVSAAYFDTEVETPAGAAVRDETISTIRIRNSKQDTGDIPINVTSLPEGNARKAQGFWRVNQLRNALDDNGELSDELEWHQKQWLSDRYHYVKLLHDNRSGNTIYIISSELSLKMSFR